MLMLSPIQSKHSKCVTLESPKRLYDKLLIHTDENFGNKEKNVFEFSFRNVLPCAVLETRNSFMWFQSLEQRGKLSWMDISSLTDFFEEASIEVLVSSAQEYQAKIKIIRFLQRHLQVKLPEIRLDEKLNEKWSSGQDLPKHYLKRCQMLFSATQCVESVNRIRCLFSKGVLLLVNSCSTPTDDWAQLACLKLLYLANQFYVRFKEIIIDDKELLNIEPLPSGKFYAYDNRRRTLATQRRKSSVQVESRQHLSLLCGSLKCISFTAVIMLLSFLLVLYFIMLPETSVSCENDHV